MAGTLTSHTSDLTVIPTGHPSLMWSINQVFSTQTHIAKSLWQFRATLCFLRNYSLLVQLMDIIHVKETLALITCRCLPLCFFSYGGDHVMSSCKQTLSIWAKQLWAVTLPKMICFVFFVLFSITKYLKTLESRYTYLRMEMTWC